MERHGGTGVQGYMGPSTFGVACLSPSPSVRWTGLPAHAALQLPLGDLTSSNSNAAEAGSWKRGLPARPGL